MSVRIPEPEIPKRWLLDANVIFSEWSRLFCVELASRWGANLAITPLIEEEAFRNLIKLGRITSVDAERQRLALCGVLGADMLHANADAYLNDVKFVDQKDRPIAASALWMHHEYHADVALVTWNIKDFPRKQLLKKRVVRYTPDELAVAVCRKRGLAPAEVLDCALARLVRHFGQHPLLEPTTFVQKARPLPSDELSWQDFLKRNRLNLLARLRERRANGNHICPPG